MRRLAPWLAALTLGAVLVLGLWWLGQEPAPVEGPVEIPLGETVRQTFPGPEGEPEVWTVSKREANRDETPEAIRIAVPYIERILKAMHIPIVVKEGYEADDIIGTLAKQAEKQGYATYMVTPDKDFAQLVSENIFMYKPGFRGGYETWGIKEVQDKFEVDQTRVAETP